MTEQNQTEPTSKTLRPSLKNLALVHLSQPSQRQLVETLADSQALPDDHPIWSIVAMFAVAMSKTPVGVDSDSDAVEKTLAEIRDELHALNAGHKILAAEISALTARLDAHLADISKVIAGAANLNRQMPKFLDSLKAALLPKPRKTPD